MQTGVSRNLLAKLPLAYKIQRQQLQHTMVQKQNICFTVAVKQLTDNMHLGFSSSCIKLGKPLTSCCHWHTVTQGSGPATSSSIEPRHNPHEAMGSSSGLGKPLTRCCHWCVAAQSQGLQVAALGPTEPQPNPLPAAGAQTPHGRWWGSCKRSSPSWGSTALVPSPPTVPTHPLLATSQARAPQTPVQLLAASPLCAVSNLGSVEVAASGCIRVCRASARLTAPSECMHTLGQKARKGPGLCCLKGPLLLPHYTRYQFPFPPSPLPHCIPPACPFNR